MISIVMPVKNATPYLKVCLDSIISQTHENWELLAVNDHSTDNSFEILQKYSKNDKRINVFNTNGNGIIDALRLAYSKSKGDYITRMDADDIMPPRKLELFQNKLIINPKSVATGKIKYIGENLRDGYLKYEEWMNGLVDSKSHFQEIYRECVIPSPAWMIARKQFDKIGAFDSNSYPEDYDLTFRMYQSNIPVEPIDDLVHIWRDYSERTSRNDPNYAFNAFEELKTKYFLEIDYLRSQKLVLWGGGKKGKNIALILQKHNINFYWACNNPKKIGQDIYGNTMQDINSTINKTEKIQAIIAVANPDDQVIIKSQMKSYQNIQMFWFC